MRKYFFLRGKLKDAYMYSILRDEWKEPRTLTEMKLQGPTVNDGIVRRRMLQCPSW